MKKIIFMMGLIGFLVCNVFFHSFAQEIPGQVGLIISEGYSEANNIKLPYETTVKQILQPANIKVILLSSNNQAEQKNCVRILTIKAYGHPLSAAYILGGTRYSGAVVRGMITLTAKNGDLLAVKGYFGSISPPQTISGGYATPSDAPFANAFYESSFTYQLLRIFAGDLGPSFVVNALKNPDWRVRRSAIHALESSGDPNASESFIVSLQDPEPEVRRAAASALGNLRSSKAIPLLVKAINDNDKETANIAVKALQKINDPQSIQPLLSLYQTNSSVLKEVIAVLKMFNSPDIVPVLMDGLRSDATRSDAREGLDRIATLDAVPLLIPFLKDENQWVRRYGVEMLGRIGDPKTADAIATLLNDNVQNVQDNAVWALAKLKDPRAFGPLVNMLKRDDLMADDRIANAGYLSRYDNPLAIQKLTDMIQQKNIYSTLRAGLVQVLEETKDPKLFEFLVSLLKKDQDLWVQGAAAVALGKTKDPKALPILLDALKKTKSADLQSYIATGLGELGTLQTVKPLAEIVKNSKSDNVLVAGVKALASIDSPEVEKLFGEYTSKYYLESRRIILDYLVKKNNPGSIKPMIEGLKQKALNNYPEDTAQTVAALCKISDPETVSAYVDTINHDILRFRWYVYLAKLKDPRAVKPLCNALHDKDVNIRWNAAEALGYLNNPAAVEPLITALNDNDLLVIKKAIGSLGELKANKAVPILLEMLKTCQDKQITEAILLALSNINTRDSLKPLVDIVNNNSSWEMRYYIVDCLRFH